MAKIGDRLRHAWNAFNSRDDTDVTTPRGAMYSSGGWGHRPDGRGRLSVTNERSIISAIYTRIGIDVASIDVRHVRTDDQGRYSETLKSGLNNCLTLEANIDQASRAFMLDAAMSLLDTGCIAIVPVDTTVNPTQSGGFDILTLRVGRITTWYPEHVTVDLFNEKTGNHQEVTVPKSMTAIVENRLFAVMNEPNSTLTRLVQKLVLLDAVDKQSSSGKLDIIIQLPYQIRSEARRQQAMQRQQAEQQQRAAQAQQRQMQEQQRHQQEQQRQMQDRQRQQMEQQRQQQQRAQHDRGQMEARNRDGDRRQ